MPVEDQAMLMGPVGLLEVFDTTIAKRVRWRIKELSNEIHAMYFFFCVYLPFLQPNNGRHRLQLCHL